MEKSTLAKYNVEKLEDLPINFSGILMQEDEEYGNMVWDKHFGNLYKQLEKQKKNYPTQWIFKSLYCITKFKYGNFWN